MEGRWFYHEDQTTTGPFSWSKLIALSKAGLINSSTFVWREGEPEWVTFGVVMAGMRPEPPPPIPETEVESPGPRRPSTAWIETPPAPWRRYGARMLDSTINGYVGVFVLAFAWYAIAPISAQAFFSSLAGPSGVFIDVMITVLIAAMVGGFVIGSMGTSVGKAIFGIKVLSPNGGTIGIGAGLLREFRVWFFGLGLGIPIVALFAAMAAYNRLKADGVTSWDKGQHLVLYRPPGTFQTVMNIIGFTLAIILVSLARALSRS